MLKRTFIYSVIAIISWCQSVTARAAVTNTVKRLESPSGESKVYVLAPNDVVQIKVYQEDDLRTEARISKDGMITMSLIGTVKIGGETIEQAAATITKLLAKDYLVNPQVTISITEYSKRRFTVLGEVRNQGTFEIPNEETIDLLRAISMAGGYTRIGSPRKVTVQRGSEEPFKLNADEMARGKVAPFRILPGDTITVGEKAF